MQYVGSDKLRSEFKAMYNGSPGIMCPNEEMWGLIFDMAEEDRILAYAEVSEQNGFTQVVPEENVIFWLDDEQKVSLMFFFARDRGDRQRIQRYFELVRDVRPALSFTIMGDHGYEVMSATETGCLKHDNHIDTHKPASKPEKETRFDDDMHVFVTEKCWDSPVKFYSMAMETIAAGFAEQAANYGFVQRVEDETILWSAEDGEVRAIYRIIDDDNINSLVRLYETIDRTGCPQAAIITNMTAFGGGVFRVYRASDRHSLALDAQICEYRLLPIFGSHFLEAEKQWARAQLVEAEPTKDAVILEDLVSNFGEIADRLLAEYPMPRGNLIAHLACLRAAGAEDLQYEDLVALFGHGTTFGYSHRPNKPFAEYNPPLTAPLPGAEERMQDAAGVEIEKTVVETPQAAWDLITSTIDEGQPLHLPSHRRLLGSVVAGYCDAPDECDRRVLTLSVPYAMGLPDTRDDDHIWFSCGDWIDFGRTEPTCSSFPEYAIRQGRPAAKVVGPGRGIWWSWRHLERWVARGPGKRLGVLRYSAKGQPKTDVVAAELIRSIVEWSIGDPRAEGTENGEWGLDGLESYAADIANPKKTPGDFHLGWIGDFAIYIQWTARRCLATYLRRVAKEFTEGTSPSIITAAEKLEMADTAWREWEEHLGFRANPRAWQDRERRVAGADAVRKAVGHEGAALEDLKKAVAAMR